MEPALAELKERAERAELVGRFAQAIALQIDLPHVLAESIARTRELCDADGASLLLIDEDGFLYFDQVSGPVNEGLQRVRLRPGQGIAGRVAMTATPHLRGTVISCRPPGGSSRRCRATAPSRRACAARTRGRGSRAPRGAA